MMKIYKLKNELVFSNNGFGFKAKLCDGKIEHLSTFRKIDTTDLGKGWTLRSKKGEELSNSFVRAALNYSSTWEIDNLPVRILHSGAGYYAGCFDLGLYGGPYCRVSDYYFDSKAECAAWIWQNDPTREEAEYLAWCEEVAHKYDDLEQI